MDERRREEERREGRRGEQTRVKQNRVNSGREAENKRREACVCVSVCVCERALRISNDKRKGILEMRGYHVGINHWGLLSREMAPCTDNGQEDVWGEGSGGARAGRTGACSVRAGQNWT